MSLFTNGPTTTSPITSTTISGFVSSGTALLLEQAPIATTGAFLRLNKTTRALSELGLRWINESIIADNNGTISAAWSEFLTAANDSLGELLLSNETRSVGEHQPHKPEEEEEEPTGMYYSVAQAIFIVLLATILSITTVVGNFMVLISFKMDKQLQTISNYFLLSLAVADFAIGLVSMPLYTVYLLLGYWPFGALLCDSWLSLDYLLSNASVLNLLIISFDRYFSVTRPLTYRARRTTRRAIFMISCAWVISLILWPPWIFAWPYIEGKRTVEKHKCYIQFLKTNLYITFGTAIAAFYIPVSVMCILYWQIWRETEKRQKDLTNLQVGQAVKKDNSKRSTSSDDVVEQEDFKRTRSDSSAITQVLTTNVTSGPTSAHSVAASLSAPVAQDSLEIETTYVPTSELCVDNPSYLKAPGRTKSQNLMDIICSTCHKYCKIDKDVDVPDVDEESTSDAGGGGGGGHGSPGNTTPASAETPVQSTVSRCTSLTLKQEPLTAVTMGGTMIPLMDRPTGNGVRGAGVGPMPAGGRSPSSDSVYTILIRLPLDNYPEEAVDNQPSIRMIAEEEEPQPTLPLHLNIAETSLHDGGALIAATRRTASKESPRFERECSQSSETSTVRDEGILGAPAINALRRTTKSDSPRFERACSQGSNEASECGGRRTSQPPDTIKLPLNTKLVPKQAMAKAVVKKKKKKTQERKQDRKAAKTLSAILLAFIITWTPYNILVLVQTLAYCGDECVPIEIWDLVYYLCYINSTVNPLCYALCNASFRRTYVRILTCKWHTKKRNPNRGYYN